MLRPCAACAVLCALRVLCALPVCVLCVRMRLGARLRVYMLRVCSPSVEKESTKQQLRRLRARLLTKTQNIVGQLRQEL